MNAFEALAQQRAGGLPAPPPTPQPTAPVAAATPTGPPPPITFAPQFQPYASLVMEAAKTNNVDPADLYGIMKTESNFNPDAVSPAGAEGLMQLMGPTAAEVGVTNRRDPKQSIAGGAKYYRRMLDQFGGDRDKALAAYNAGPGRVASGRPLPPETQAYVPKVQKARAEFTLPDSAMAQANSQVYDAPAEPPPPVPTPQLTDKAGEPKAPKNAIQAMKDLEPPSPLGNFMSHPDQAIKGAYEGAKNAATWVKEHPRESARVALELAMMTGGAILTPEVAVPIAAARYPALIAKVVNLFSKMGGAALGGAAGSLASETFDPSGSPQKAIGRAEQAFQAGGLGEGAGQAATKGVEWAFAPYRSRLVPGAERTRDLINAQRRPDETRAIPQSVLVDSPGANIVEHSLELPIGGGFLSKARQQSEELAQRAFQTFPDRFGAPGRTPVERATGLQQSMTRALEQMKRASDADFAMVDQLNQAPGALPIRVDLRPAKLAAAQRWIEHSGGIVNPATTKLVNDLLARPDVVSFRDAAQLRSDMLKIRDPEAVVQGQMPALGDTLSKVIDAQIDQAGRMLNPRALGAWRRANLRYKGDPAQGIVGIQQFENDIMGKLMTGPPDQFASTLFSKNRPVRIEDLQRMLPNRADRDELRHMFVEKLVQEVGMDPSGKSLGQALFKYGDVVNTTLGRRHADDLRHIAEAIQRTQNSVGDHKTPIRIGQGSVIMSMMYSNVGVGRTAAVMIIPGAMAWALSRPAVAHWLSIGVNLPPAGRQAIQAIARIKALAKADKMPIYEVPASWLEPGGQPEGTPPLPVAPPPAGPPRVAAQSTPTDTTSSGR